MSVWEKLADPNFMHIVGVFGPCVADKSVCVCVLCVRVCVCVCACVCV